MATSGYRLCHKDLLPFAELYFLLLQCLVIVVWLLTRFAIDLEIVLYGFVLYSALRCSLYCIFLALLFLIFSAYTYVLLTLFLGYYIFFSR